MITLSQTKELLAQNKEELRKQYKVSEIGVFGSYTRNEQSKGSDLDVLVTFEEPVGMFSFLDLEEYLQKLLNVKVDLVSKKSLKPNIGKRILKEVIYI